MNDPKTIFFTVVITGFVLILVSIAYILFSSYVKTLWAWVSWSEEDKMLYKKLSSTEWTVDKHSSDGSLILEATFTSMDKTVVIEYDGFADSGKESFKVQMGIYPNQTESLILSSDFNFDRNPIKEALLEEISDLEYQNMLQASLYLSNKGMASGPHF